jgi:hypothetical protein
MPFNFSLGLVPIARSLRILASVNGFIINSVCEVTQVAVSNNEWVILADLREKYLSYHNEIQNVTVLKICDTAEEAAELYLQLLEKIVFGR